MYISRYEQIQYVISEGGVWYGEMGRDHPLSLTAKLKFIDKVYTRTWPLNKKMLSFSGGVYGGGRSPYVLQTKRCHSWIGKVHNLVVNISRRWPLKQKAKFKRKRMQKRTQQRMQERRCKKSQAKRQATFVLNCLAPHNHYVIFRS